MKILFTAQSKLAIIETGGSIMTIEEVLKKFPGTEKGEWRQTPHGGWVQQSARVEYDCIIADNAIVSGNARVFGNAWIYGHAWVYGYALVNASVSNSVRV